MALAAPYLAVIVLGVGIASPAIYMMNAARAYVAGEGLYSKAQKRAVLHLTRFARSGDPAEWEAYRETIAVPQADGRALAALRAPVPDTEAAAEALRAGGNHVEDIPGMLRLFRWARFMPEMRDAIGIWSDADREIARLDAAAHELAAVVRARDSDPEDVSRILRKIALIDGRLTEHEEAFSSVLGRGARRLNRLSLATAWLAAALLVTIGWFASRKVASTIRRRAAVFESLIAHAHDGITVLDGKGRIVFESPAVETLLGHPPAERVGTHSLSWVHADDRERAREAFASAAREPLSIDLRLRSKHEGWRILACRAGSFPMAGEAPGLVVNSRDVTEQRSLERRLAEAERLESVGRLAGGVAHDFNNLITVIASTAELAGRADGSGDALAADLELIQETCDRAARLTGQLLTFARREVVEPRVVDINGALRELELILRPLIRDGVDLSLDLCPEEACVKIDRAQFDRLVLNLVVNAGEAVAEGGTIRISTRAIDHEVEYLAGSARNVRLDVVDSGPRLSEEVRSRMFEPFFSTKPEGVGMGLATCYGIMQQSGGVIRVEPEPVRGTRLFAIWPAADEAPTELVTRAADAPAASETATILYAEDEPGVRRVITRLLEKSGYTVHTATDGEDALRVAQARPDFDLLLTDVSMPRIGGRELAERLRKERPVLPVVFMSGYTEDEALRTAIREGNASFVAKPADPASLRRALREHLQEARWERHASP